MRCGWWRGKEVTYISLGTQTSTAKEYLCKTKGQTVSVSTAVPHLWHGLWTRDKSFVKLTNGVTKTVLTDFLSSTSKGPPLVRMHLTASMYADGVWQNYSIHHSSHTTGCCSTTHLNSVAVNLHEVLCVHTDVTATLSWTVVCHLMVGKMYSLPFLLSFAVDYQTQVRF